MRLLIAALFSLPLLAQIHLYHQATFLTQNPAQPTATAMAVSHGRILATGAFAELRRAYPAAVPIPLSGATVLPGFNDQHLHPRPTFDESSPHYVPWLGPDAAPTLDRLIEILRRKASLTSPGQLVSGLGYQDTVLGRHPTRADLDRVSTRHPVSITHSSGHISAVNSFVLSATQVTRDTPDPDGGALDRDASGEPTGVLRESARRLVGNFSGSGSSLGLADLPPAVLAEGLARTFRLWVASGLTSINVAGISIDQFRAYQLARQLGHPLRVGLMISDWYFPEAQKAGLTSGFGDAFLRLTAIKVFHGNSLSGRTCWLSEPYEGRPDYFGIPPARSQAELDAHIRDIVAAGWQVATHANGDREIDMVLTAYERANPRPDSRLRVEHASVMTPALLDRSARQRVILAFHSYMDEHGDKLEEYGPRRLELMHAHREGIRRGIPMVGNSDSPVSSYHPLRRIQDLVLRTGRNGKVYGSSQVLTVEEALALHTRAGAYATFEEKEKGMLAPGMLADFVVLDADPRRVPAAQIANIRIRATVIQGEKVFGDWQVGTARR